MKKIIIFIISSILLSSCVSYKQENLNLNLSVNKKYFDLGGNDVIALMVVDDRIDKTLLGNKRVGEKSIDIRSKQNLVEVVRDKVVKDLERNSFLVEKSEKFGESTSTSKTLKVEIVTFHYNACREFFISNAKVDILLRMTAQNKAGEKYVTDKNFSLDRDHFIMPLISTDEKTINAALQEVLDTVFENQKLLEFLKS